MADTTSLILDLLHSQMLGVVSTVNDAGSPESALVAFAETPELEIIFGTFNDTRKFRNIQEHSTISFVVGGDNKSIQIEGRAHIADGSESQQCADILVSKNPRAARFVTEPRERFVLLRPTWIRFTNFGTKPETVFELRP